jgi:Tol biopolymer transport system component
MLRFWLICLSLAAPLVAAPGLDIETMMRIRRVSDPQLSPDGKTVAFAVQSVDLAANKKTTQIYTIPLTGGTPMAITNEGSNDRPRWSPDSQQIAFVSTRGGASHVWVMNADGTRAKQVTKLATEAGGVSWFPDGKRVLFTSEVYPDCADEACNARTLKEESESKSKARTYTSLLYRHWNQWGSKRKSHLFVTSVDGGEVKDLTPGAFDVPTFSLGGQDGYAISPDGKEVCYVMNGEKDQATSTNSELWTVSPDGGDPQKITVTAGADVGRAMAGMARAEDGRLRERPVADVCHQAQGWESPGPDRDAGPECAEHLLVAGFDADLFYRRRPWAAGHPDAGD